MTTTPRRRPNSDPTAAVPAWGQRSAFANLRGLPWWLAVLLAVGTTAAGAGIDIAVTGNPALIAQLCYFVGCAVAVFLIARRNVFTAIVQPPLVLAITFPAVVLAAHAGLPEGGSSAAMLAVATPLINGFPAMAITTGLVLITGLLRMFVLQRPPRNTETSTRHGRRQQSTATRAASRPTEAEQTAPVRPSSNKPSASKPSANKPNGGGEPKDKRSGTSRAPQRGGPSKEPPPRPERRPGNTGDTGKGERSSGQWRRPRPRPDGPPPGR